MQKKDNNFPQVKFVRKPFILRPERQGVESWLEVLTKLGQSRGNPHWVDSFVPSMCQKGKAIGVNFEFDTEVGNSMDSLRLLEWCREMKGWEKQAQLSHTLAVYHFEQKKTVGRHDNLLAACEEVGISPEEAQSVLSDPTLYRKKVEEGIEEAHNNGFFSIPVFSFFVNGKLKDTTNGALSVGEYESILRTVCA
uniref:DSBA-like thioredoxin domain-containing protein n=1 Tax=Paramoeba aestuarina TaxID=180227 RepID=A0A7S4P0F0_9EUKA|mmetsp:Transcript_34028/g.53228  ORF Transcript_34028/g.53228 Transcript_34028/m.53228 type:complete len:194 (+) Transcript_34028:137-718(+)